MVVNPAAFSQHRALKFVFSIGAWALFEHSGFLQQSQNMIGQVVTLHFHLEEWSLPYVDHWFKLNDIFKKRSVAFNFSKPSVPKKSIVQDKTLLYEM